MKTTLRILAVLVFVALLGSVAWLPSQDTYATTPSRSLSGLDLVHSVGTVIEGTKVEHAFTTKNELSVPIDIVNDTDLEKSCGCMTLECSPRSLAPGEVATVKMQVNTAGKNGRFRVGGLIRWRAADGGSWPVNLYIEGTAKTILASQPGLVQFSAADVAEQSTKELLVFHSRDVNWSTMNVQIDPPYAAVVEKSVRSDHMRLLLRPCPPADASDFSATLQLTAELAEAEADVTRSSLAVLVQGSQSLDVHVSPRAVFANWSRAFNSGRTRFLVRGLASTAAAPISLVSCDGFRTQWVAKDISALNSTGYRTMQIELSLSHPDDPEFDLTQARRVRIALAGGQSLEVPVYFVIQQERS